MGRRKPRTNPRKQGHSDRSGKAGGALWLYGAHAVAAALANPARTPGRLMATREAADRLAAEAPGLAAAPEICDRNAIDSVLPKGAVHQGVALSTGPLPYTALEDVTETAGEKALVVVLDQVTDPQNVGAILRSAAVFGAAAVVLPARNAAPESGALRSGSTTAAAPNTAAERRIAPTFCGSVTWSSTTTRQRSSPVSVMSSRAV